MLTFSRVLTQKDGDLSTYFDMNDESEKSNENSSMKELPVNNHVDVNKKIIGGHLTLENFFGFCKSIKKISKVLGFKLELNSTNRKQDNQ